jgi:large subunit ribosomal protein L4
MSAIVIDTEFNKTSERLELPESFKNINPHNLYLYVKAYQAAMRANTARAKNRALVSGGGKKPWSQKGRGTARAGSIRSPLFVGGGVVFGPTKRNYTQKVNKKQKALALKYALNAMAEEGKLFVVDSVNVASGKTKDAFKKFQNLGVKSVSIFVSELDEVTARAFRNIPKCELLLNNAINGYTVSKSQAVVLDRNTWQNITKES